MKKENTGFKKLKKSGKVWIAIATFAVIGMGTVSVNADDSMSSTDIIVVAEPTTPPVTEEPTTPPVTEEPTTPPVTTEPTTPPVTEEPTTPPVTEEPTTPPVTEEPTTPPVTEEPGTTDPGTTDPGTTDPGTTDPGTTDPTTPPVTEEPTTSNPGKDSKPEKPNKGNSTPVFIPTAEKPLVTEGKNEIVGIEGNAVLVKQNDQTVKMSANEVGGTVLDNGDIQVKNDKGEVKTLKVLPNTSDNNTLLPVVGIILMILTFLLTSKKKEENL
ncbi:hypothetical protein BKX95_09925 [Streptococcus iniae]|nr:hypothetical protein BKX95_09925 [Streptococcus iniae]